MMPEILQDTAISPLHVLVAERLYAPEEIAGPVAVVLEGTTIRDIWRGMDADAVRHRFGSRLPGSKVEVTDLGSWSLAPGYIDLHIHGFCGYDATTGQQEDVEAIARELPRTGVTSFFPTIATLDQAKTVEQVRRVVGAAAKQISPSASEILGLRLEGPFISRTKKGAQYEPGIRPPDPVELETLAAEGCGWVRLIDYAPEEDEASRFLAMMISARHSALHWSHCSYLRPGYSRY